MIAYAIINLLVDLSYAWFDPRIRLRRRSADDDRLDTDRRVAGRPSSRSTAPERLADVADLGAARPLAQDVWRRFKRNKLAVVGLIFIVILMLVARSSPPDRALRIAERDTGALPRGPVARSLVRHRQIGRDVFSRVVYGARVSLRIGIIATAIALVIGVVLGALAGFFGGGSDTLIMRFTDIFLAIPYIVLARRDRHRCSGAARTPVILVLGLTGWLGITRIVRVELPVA